MLLELGWPHLYMHLSGFGLVSEKSIEKFPESSAGSLGEYWICKCATKGLF